MNFNARNIIGGILILAGISLYVIITFTGINNWFQLIPGAVCIFLSFIAFDFITIKAIKETFEIAKGVKKNDQAEQKPSQGSKNDQ